MDIEKLAYIFAAMIVFITLAGVGIKDCLKTEFINKVTNEMVVNHVPPEDISKFIKEYSEAN